jgi:2-dehydro-3-deoxyphosphogluconate aldolase/(4S)-4-hydroxy-2-oxoglutarate aldolase
MTSIDDVMRTAPVIPVLTIEDIADARPIAEALIAGGLSVLEVTLRTPAALDIISEIARVPGAIVGAGTVLNRLQLRQCIDAGAKFAVSPGLTDSLADAARESALPFLPGVATASEIMRGLDHGLDRFKFFPAEASGGIAALMTLSGPFGNVRFCPTGGIGAESATDWLNLDAVLCVGGSWVVPSSNCYSTDEIETRARAAAALGSNLSRRH